MIKQVKRTFYVFVTRELLNSKPSFEVGVNLHLVIIPKSLKEEYDNSYWKKVLDPILFSSKGQELITSNEIEIL